MTQRQGAKQKPKVGNKPVRDEKTGRTGVVIRSGKDGNPVLRYDDDNAEVEVSAGNLTLTKQAKVSVGDRIKNVRDGRTGIVDSFGKKGEPNIKFDDDDKVAPSAWDKIAQFDALVEELAVGDRIKDKQGRVGTVIRLTGKGGAAIIRYDDDDTEAEVNAADATITRKAKVTIGDRTKNIATGRTGRVVGVGRKGEIEVQYDDDDTIVACSPHYFDKFDPVKDKMAPGDRVKDLATGRAGVVLRVDAQGDPQIRFEDDGTEAALAAGNVLLTRKGIAPTCPGCHAEMVWSDFDYADGPQHGLALPKNR